MTDASPIPTGPSSDSPSRPSTRLGAAAETAPPVLAGVLETATSDSSIRPQDDLFRFVNGGWLATAEIPADRPSSGAFTVLRDEAEAACRQIVEELAEDFSTASSEVLRTNRGRVGALYAAFMDQKRLEKLGAEPLTVELAPVLAASSKEELARALGEMTPLGFMGVVGADVEVDINDPQRYTSWIGQSGLGLPDESYYREEAQAPLRQAYVAHVATMLELAGLTESLTASGESLAERVMVVETDLAKGHWDRVTCRDVEKMNNPMSWQEIMDSAPGLPWQEWREGILTAARAAGVERTTFLDEAIVTQPDYLPHAAGVWQGADLEDLKAWAAWHVVHGRATLLSSAFVEENFAFYSRTLQGVDQLRARWKRAVGLVESTMGEALGELYAARHFPPAHKERMKALVERGRQNALANRHALLAPPGKEGVQFRVANLFEFDLAAWQALGRVDRLLIDPPRDGALAVARVLAALPPEQRPARMVYVSCNPATLARDLGLMVNEGKWRVRMAGVANMFPHTAHVESIALLEA